MEKYYCSDTIHENKCDQLVVLFTGGRDSSLVVSLSANQGKFVFPLTCDNGTIVNSEISNFRYKELKKRFPENIGKRIIIPSHGLFRRIAIKDIELDFSKFHKNLILLGDQLVIHTQAIIFCLANDIKEIASGFVSYQNDLAEQKKVSIDLLKSFIGEYGIHYSTPIYEYKTLDDVKYQLMDFGISTKSLEGFSIYADSFTEPSQELVGRYMKSKLDICREFIDLKLQTGKK